MTSTFSETVDNLAVDETAAVIGVSIDTVRRWHKKGLIKATRGNMGKLLFDTVEVRRMADKYRGGVSGINNYRILHNEAAHGFSSIELFAGAGGTALGFEHAGFEHELLVEIDKNAVATLKQNRPDWDVFAGDVADVDYSGMSADVVVGGFPCQAFSYAGNKRGFDDVRGTLFFEFARCVQEVRPKIAIGENVRGLLRHDEGRTLKTMVAILEEIGYSVEYRVMRAQYLDVPQKRERLIIVAIRNDVDTQHIFPKERDYTVSLAEALDGVPHSPGQEYSERKRFILEQVPAGGYWRDLPDELQREYMKASYFMGGGKTGMARRLAWEEPSLTLTCNPAQKQTERCHPEETRPLRVREYARIQTFPDDWKFAGSVSAQYKQIGNAVPVNLGFHVAQCVAAMLDPSFYDEETMLVVTARKEGIDPSQMILI